MKRCFSSPVVASCLGVCSGEAALADRVVERCPSLIVHVPYVAEVSRVVKVAQRLGAGVASDCASGTSLRELKDHILRILFGPVETSTPEIVTSSQLFEVVDTPSGAGRVLVPLPDLVFHESPDAITGEVPVVGRQMAFGMERIILREVRLASKCSTGDEGEGLHFKFN